MKRSFFGTPLALAAALCLGGASERLLAQSAVDTAADAATDAAVDSATSAGAAASTDAATSTSAAGQSDVQSSAQPQTAVNASTSQDATVGASVDTQTPPTPSSIQADATADANLDASASTDASPATDAASSTDAAASTTLDASAQGQGGTADSQASAQQNLQAGLQFGQATERGLAINNVARSHFFYNSGIRPGDVLVSYGGRPIRNHADFNRWVVFQPGHRIPIVVLRQGRPQTIYVAYQGRPGFDNQASYPSAHSGAYLGVTFEPQSRQALVRTVTPGSPAESAGIRPGDTIVGLNGRPVGASQEVIRIVSTMQPGEPLDVAVSRQVVLGHRPGVAQAATYAPDARIQGSITTPGVPAVSAPAATADSSVEAGVYTDGTTAVPGGARFDNTPARAGDADRDGRLLDNDGRVGPVEGRAILPRRRN